MLNLFFNWESFWGDAPSKLTSSEHSEFLSSGSAEFSLSLLSDKLSYTYCFFIVPISPISYSWSWLRASPSYYFALTSSSSNLVTCWLNILMALFFWLHFSYNWSTSISRVAQLILASTSCSSYSFPRRIWAFSYCLRLVIVCCESLDWVVVSVTSWLASFRVFSSDLSFITCCLSYPTWESSMSFLSWLFWQFWRF